MITIKSIEEHSDQIVQDIENKTNQTTPAVPFAFNRVIADAMGAQTVVSQLHNVDQRKECFALTASEDIGLKYLAIETNTPRLIGVRAELSIIVTGREGVTIGTYANAPEFVKDSVVYITTQGATITGGTATISIQAKSYGENGTLQAGDKLYLSSSDYQNIDSEAIVDSILVSGANEETVDSWRNRIIQEKAFPSTNSGTTSWFAKAAQRIAGITACYPYSADTIGKVELYCVAGAEVDGIPTQAQLDAVETVFEAAPYDCLWSTLNNKVTAFASEVEEYDVEITQSAVTLSEPTKQSIISEVDKYFSSRYPYIEGFSVSNNAEIRSVDVFSVALSVIKGKVNEGGSIASVEITSTIYPGADLFTLQKGKRAKANITFV